MKGKPVKLGNQPVYFAMALAICGALLVLMKILGIIQASWWIVTALFWGPILVTFVTVVILFAFTIFKAMLQTFVNGDNNGWN